MTALIMDRSTDQLGTPDVVLPVLLSFPVEANTQLYAGGMVAINAAGNAVPASALNTLKLVGRCERDVNNLTGAGPGLGTAGAQNVLVHQGVFFYNCPDSSISGANVLAPCFAVDDNNVSLSDAGGVRPYAGVIYAFNESGLYPQGAGQVAVLIGFPAPYGNTPVGVSTAGSARMVATAINAYGGSGTGVLTASSAALFGTIDGIVPALNDIILVPEGLTNLTAPQDAGPWQMTTVGTASVKWVLTRPDWWASGSTLPEGASVKIGEGTLFAGTTWRSFAAKGSAVVDTNDPDLYPTSVTQQATLLTGTASVTITNVPVRSTSKSNVLVNYISGSAAVTTVGYASKVITNGYLNTASVTVYAMAAGMTAVGSGDVSVVNVTIVN
jgi:hypothetical protein